MGRFTLPRDLYHGKNALEALKTLKGKKAVVVVGGGSMKRFGFLDKVVSYLQEAGMEESIYSLQADPYTPVVSKENSPRYALNGALYCIRATGQSLTYWAYFDPATGEYRMQTVMDADASKPA